MFDCFTLVDDRHRTTKKPPYFQGDLLDKSIKLNQWKQHSTLAET